MVRTRAATGPWACLGSFCMGRKGDAYDNALCEAFFATLNREVLSRRRLRTRQEAPSVLFAYPEGFYNRRRRHSALGYLPRRSS